MEENKKKPSILSKEDINFLVIEAKSGNEEALKKIIDNYKPFIYQIVHRYIGYGVELEDLVQEGNVGLTKAIKMFDISKNNTLMTFAFYYVQKEIISAINAYGRGVKITKYGYQKMKEYNMVQEELFKKLGRYPSVSEIAKEMHIPYNSAFSLFICIKGIVSLDYEYDVNDGSDTHTLKDFLKDEEDSLDNRIILKELREEIKEYFNKCKLNDKERIVIMLKYGFINNRIYERKQIGFFLHLTEERIRQIEADALRKMRCKKNETKAFLSYLQYKELCLNNLERYNEAYKDKRNKRKSLS